MKDVNNSNIKDYRNIFKATSLFGGVQLFKILIQIINQKIIAILLGPTGMGISGLFTSTISLIQALTSMGLSSSAVRSVAEADGSGDNEKILKVVTVLRKLVWGTGLLGMILVIILSPLLSKLAFGNLDFTIPFIFLSLTLLFQQLSAGQSVILQGLRRLKDLAKSSILGSFFGLIISAPIYYFFGIKGIVPTLILNSITMLGLTWYFSNKLKIKPIKINPKQTLLEGKDMLKMGLVMSLNNILVLGVGYTIRLYIMKLGGTEEVGLYTAGFAIVNGYVGLVFTAMGTDYYPRLAAVNKNDSKCIQTVNQQAEISILIIGPIIILFLLLAPYTITLLYSNKFIPITGFMQWAILGMLFKSSSWAISYIFIAKAHMKSFAINETIANIIVLLFNIIGYSIWGLNGLGVAFSLSYLIYFIIVYYKAKLKYGFKFSSELIATKTKFILLSLICFYIMYFNKSNINVYVVIIIALISIIYSLYKLNSKINLISSKY